MVKSLIIVVLLLTGAMSKNIYERNCVKCHEALPTSLQRMFMNYLLVYGGEKNMKAGLKHYLEQPSKHITVMSKLFTDNYGIKLKTTLTSKEVDKAIDIYWEKFKVFDKLK
jgi:hypothetical protein